MLHHTSISSHVDGARNVTSFPPGFPRDNAEHCAIGDCDECTPYLNSSQQYIRYQ